MKNEHRRRYTREFKLQALDMAETSGKSVAQIEDELGLAPGMMYRWKRQFQQVGKEAYQGKDKLADSDQEVRRLRREVEQLREERDILKKQWVSSLRKRNEVRLHRSPTWAARGRHAMPGAGGVLQWVLCVA